MVSASQPLSPIAARFLKRAQQEFRDGRAVEAAHTLRSVLALAPDHPECLRWAGTVAQQIGDIAKAAEHFTRALASAPDDPMLQASLGVALVEQGQSEDGILHLRRACELAPRAPTAWFNLGEALMAQARADDANDAYQRALALDSGYLPARLGLARGEAARGHTAAAVAGFRAVLRRDPHNAVAWFGLSYLNTVRFDGDDTARLQQAFAQEGVSERMHNLLGFALAKALEDQGEYGSAFDLFNAVNAAERKRIRWDAVAEHARGEAVMAAFAEARPRTAFVTRGHELIQIVSLPRSGASLVEQILASHPEVEGANEIKAMPRVIDQESRRRGKEFPAWVLDATAADWARLGDQYLERTRRWRQLKPRFTDKNLVNGYLVGSTLAMLPAARVVIVRRDPVETCLACYRQCFSGYAGFAYDLDEMADYCIDFTGLTNFWLARYPDRVFLLEYEALVREPEPWIRRLLDFCGLPFDPACVAFHQTSRVVLSAPSAIQVREPLRQDTARATRYGDRLDQLRERLRDGGLAA